MMSHLSHYFRGHRGKINIPSLIKENNSLVYHYNLADILEKMKKHAE